MYMLYIFVNLLFQGYILYREKEFVTMDLHVPVCEGLKQKWIKDFFIKSLKKTLDTCPVPAVSLILLIIMSIKVVFNILLEAGPYSGESYRNEIYMHT